MSLFRNLAFRTFHFGILRTASHLVSIEQRTEWLQEWDAELYHACDSLVAVDEFSWPAQREITEFCLGSFQDALYLRRHATQSDMPVPRIHSSAMQCLLWLSTVLAICAVLAHLLPGIRAEYDTIQYPLRSNLILIEGSDITDEPAVSSAQYRDWKSTTQRYFDGLAFYRSATATVSLSKARRSKFNVAVASLNAISLLGLPIQSSNFLLEISPSIPQVVLSYETWARSFHSDPHIAGRIIRIGNRSARIAGVLPCGSWRLPAHPDLWVLVPDSQIASIIKDAPGYVLAHLTPLGRSFMTSDTTFITVRGANDSAASFFGIWCGNCTEGPWKIYLFALMLALLALPAVTSVSMSESNFSSHHPSRKQNLKRWLFLVAKLFAIAAIAYFASLDIAYWNSNTYSETAELVQLIANFVLCLFGLRWALIDQQNRCPVCLRRVTHPARVGLLSQTFLGWNGTEMICTGGHTLLHVPSLPTSWFGSQRWLYLDTSWEFLFADLPS